MPTTPMLLAILSLLVLAIGGCKSDDSSSTDTAASGKPTVALGLASTIAPDEVADDDDDDGDDDGDEGDEEDEVEIPLSEVPDHVLEAARDAVPGIVLEEAERETEGDVVVYGLEGEADGSEYEVEVSAAGEVLEIELDDEDDDD